MEDEQVQSTGGQFAQFILDEWKEASDYGKQVRFNLMADKKDTGQLNIFIVALCQLWMQLKPKVKGKSFAVETLEKDFLKYEGYSIDPKKLISIESDTAKEGVIFGMEGVIRQVIEELGITQWGD